MARTREHLGLQVPEHRVDRRAVVYWALSALLRWGAAWLLVRWIRNSLPGWLADVPQLLPWVPDVLLWLDRLGLVILVIGAVMVFLAPPVRYLIHRWEVDTHGVYVRDGLLRIAWRIAPTARIQVVHVRRNLLELMLGLSSVIVSTASSYGPLIIVGLDRNLAARVAASLEHAAEQVPGEAT